ncbi:MAG: ABC transporter, partial [Leifsonia sp.]
MTTQQSPPRVVAAGRRSGGVGSLYSGEFGAVIGRGLRATKSSNYIVVASGFFEPVFYLLSLGLGLGSYIGAVHDGGHDIPYAAYI